MGAFTPNGITYGSPYLLTTAQGNYYNELTGVQSNDVVNLRGLSQIGTVGAVTADTVINVNALSTMTVSRITKLATRGTASPSFAAARIQATREALGALYVYSSSSILSGTTINGVAQPANLTALDLSQNQAAGNQLLAAVSALVMTAGTTASGVNTLLSQISVDLADDGVLNNSVNYPVSVQSQLCAAAASTNFATVATNLNKVYGTTYAETDISQWVDTSGCVDQVINKCKFNGTATAGTESKSPSYAVGPDDVATSAERDVRRIWLFSRHKPTPARRHVRRGPSRRYRAWWVGSRRALPAQHP
jgi:hypothetical protein